MTYDVEYFLAKFQAIPEHEWCQHDYTDAEGRHCAAGFCIRSERIALSTWFRRIQSSALSVNDDLDHRYLQPTPKQRILAALRDIRAQRLTPV